LNQMIRELLGNAISIFYQVVNLILSKVTELQVEFVRSSGRCFRFL